MMRWCNLNTNEHVLQAKTCPNICTQHKLHILHQLIRKCISSWRTEKQSALKCPACVNHTLKHCLVHFEQSVVERVKWAAQVTLKLLQQRPQDERLLKLSHWPVAVCFVIGASPFFQVITIPSLFHLKCNGTNWYMYGCTTFSGQWNFRVVFHHT